MDPRAKAALAAWSRYASTVLMGGTPQQRRWAFEKAMEAEEKLALAEFAERARERRRKAGTALHGS